MDQIQNQKLKSILNKPHEERSEQEIEKLVSLLEKAQIQEELDGFTSEDLVELTRYIKYDKQYKGNILVPWGDKNKQIRLVLSGTLKMFEKNNSVQDWYWANSIYNCLRQWKRTEFDPLIEGLMMDEYNNFKGQIELILNRKLDDYRNKQSEINNRLSQKTFFKNMSTMVDKMKTGLQNQVNMQLWKKEKLQEEASSFRFDLESFIQLNTIERRNLHMIRQFGCICWYKQVAKFSKGQTIGKDSLNEINGFSTNYSIYVAKNSEMAVLDYDSIKLVRKIIENRILQQKVDFLKKFLKDTPFFQNLDESDYENMARNCRKLLFLHRKSVFKQGKKPTYIFIIEEGEFEITRNTVKYQQFIDKKLLNESKAASRAASVYNSEIVSSNGDVETPPVLPLNKPMF